MKRLKFLMVAFTLLMGISLTSCLNSSDSESSFDGYGYMRAKNYMGISWFEDLDGNKYYPTESSLATMKSNYGFDITESDLVLLYYKNVETANTAGKSIQLVGATSVDSYGTEMEETIEDMQVGNAPVVSLTPVDNYGNYRPSLYGAEMVILPISWKMENKVETLAQHTFRLVYVKEAQKDGTELVLYLQHDKGTDTKTDGNALRTKAYDIKNIMNAIKNSTGKYPAKVTIKAKVADDGETMPEAYTDYEIDAGSLNK